MIFCSFDDACVPKCRFIKSFDFATTYGFYHYDLYDKLKELGFIEDIPFLDVDDFRIMFQNLYHKCEKLWRPKNKVLVSYDGTRAPDDVKARMMAYDEAIKSVIPGIRSIQARDDGERHCDGEWCHYVDSVKHDVYKQIFGYEKDGKAG